MCLLRPKLLTQAVHYIRMHHVEGDLASRILRTLHPPAVCFRLLGSASGKMQRRNSFCKLPMASDVRAVACVRPRFILAISVRASSGSDQISGRPEMCQSSDGLHSVLALRIYANRGSEPFDVCTNSRHSGLDFGVALQLKHVQTWTSSNH